MPDLPDWTPRLVQPFSNAVCKAQDGAENILEGSLAQTNGPLLASVAVSGFTRSGQQRIGAKLALDNTRTPPTLSQSIESSLYAQPDMTHLTLLPVRQELSGFPDGPALTLKAVGVVTDGEDRCSVTTLATGTNPPLAVVRKNAGVNPRSAPMLEGFAFSSNGGVLVLSLAATGSTEGPPAVTGIQIFLDDVLVGESQIYANRAKVSQPFVPVELVLGNVPGGQHTVRLVVEHGTVHDNFRDGYCLMVLELCCPPQVMNVTQLLANRPCKDQTGALIVDAQSFTSRGGPLLVRVAASAFSKGVERRLLGVVIKIDKSVKGELGLFANHADMHLCLVPNDLLVTGVGAGSHVLELQATSDTTTDFNDRCSATIMEVASAPPSP